MKKLKDQKYIFWKINWQSWVLNVWWYIYDIMFKVSYIYNGWFISLLHKMFTETIPKAVTKVIIRLIYKLNFSL